MKGGLRRLFVALAVDDATRVELESAAQRLASLGMRGRFVPRENYHVTVAFLGSVEAAIVQSLTDALRIAVAPVSPLELELQRVGAFPNGRRPRVIWAGPSRPSAAFEALCATIWNALEPFGFTADQEPEPHVTLCRCERDAGPVPSVSLRAHTLHVSAVTLFESHLSRSGPRYIALEALPLCVNPADDASTR